MESRIISTWQLAFPSSNFPLLEGIKLRSILALQFKKCGMTLLSDTVPRTHLRARKKKRVKDSKENTNANTILCSWRWNFKYSNNLNGLILKCQKGKSFQNQHARKGTSASHPYFNIKEGDNITCIVQYMQEKAKLVEESFELFQIINRNLGAAIPKNPPRLPQITPWDNFIYQELQAVHL